MGGNLSVESEPGRGSQFHFTVCLPPAREPLGDPTPASLASLEGLPVLAVDDNSTNRRILGQTLRLHGLCPTLAASGSEALDLLREASQNGRPYPLVIVDAHMPEMDGFTLVENVKQDPRLAQSVVILLTSGGYSGDAARARELGVAAYLTKPVGERELLETILRVLGRLPDGKIPDRAGRAAPASAAPQSGSRESLRIGLRILVVDDNAVNQRLAVRLLEKHGHHALPVASGRTAIQALKTEAFDVVLMDIQMPDMDGIETTQAIREEERRTEAHVPIVAMTAHAMESDRTRCLSAGMDGYVSKPVTAQALLAAIESALAAPRTGVLAGR